MYHDSKKQYKQGSMFFRKKVYFRVNPISFATFLVILKKKKNYTKVFSSQVMYKISFINYS